MGQLDVKDKKILAVLDMDARLPYSRIAKKVRLSRDVVHYRIKELEKRGIIEGYYAAIDTSRLGLMFCRIFVKYHKMSVETEKKLLLYCRSSPVINWVTLADGPYDMVIVLLGHDMDEIETSVDELSVKFGKYFSQRYVSIAFRIFHFMHNYLYHNKGDEQLVLGNTKNGGGVYECDSVDYEILHLLSKNGRMSLLDLSKNLKSTPQMISYRLKRLQQEGVIIGYRAKMNMRSLGYSHYKVMLSLQEFGKNEEKKLLSYLRKHENVIYITKPLGQHDYEFEIMVKDANELHEIMREFSFTFADVLVKYDTVLYYHEPVVEYFPSQ